MAAHSTSSPNYCSNPTLAAAQMEYVREVWSGSYEGIRRQTLSLIDRTCSSAALQRLDLLEVEPCFIELRLGVDVFRNFKIAVLNHLNTKQLNQLVALNLSNFMPDPKGQTVLDLGIQILSKTNKLAYLYLNKFLFGEPPTPRPIQYTGGIEYLSTIYLSNPSITTGSIQTLDATKGTVEADLVEELPGKGHNGNPDLTKMGAALLANPRLLRLSMESNGISTAEAITGLQLDQHPSLQRLDLKKNPLDTKAIIKIAEIISLNSHLQHVNLSDCPLTVEGFEALGHMLTANDTLLELDLSKEKDIQAVVSSHQKVFII